MFDLVLFMNKRFNILFWWFIFQYRIYLWTSLTTSFLKILKIQLLMRPRICMHKFICILFWIIAIAQGKINGEQILNSQKLNFIISSDQTDTQYSHQYWLIGSMGIFTSLSISFEWVVLKMVTFRWHGKFFTVNRILRIRKMCMLCLTVESNFNYECWESNAHKFFFWNKKASQISSKSKGFLRRSFEETGRNRPWR